MLPFSVSLDLEDFLEWLLSWDARHRPITALAREHPWLDLCPEKDLNTELTFVQPLGVPEDPETQEHLAGLGMPGSLGPDGHSPVSLG